VLRIANFEFGCGLATQYTLCLWLTFTQAHSAVFLLSFLGRFDEFDERDHLCFGCLTETPIPLFWRKLCPKMGLHWKILLPAHNSARTGEVTAFHQAISKGDLAAQLRASDLKVIFHALYSNSSIGSLWPLTKSTERGDMVIEDAGAVGIMEYWNGGILGLSSFNWLTFVSH
jgi:hypothetical protein